MNKGHTAADFSAGSFTAANECAISGASVGAMISAISFRTVEGTPSGPEDRGDFSAFNKARTSATFLSSVDSIEKEYTSRGTRIRSYQQKEKY